MYESLYASNAYRNYPLFALMVFLASFIGVFVWAYWPRRQLAD
jgi:cbb3-type cytochrome oxidase subunit 3